MDNASDILMEIQIICLTIFMWKMYRYILYKEGKENE